MTTRIRPSRSTLEARAVCTRNPGTVGASASRVDVFRKSRRVNMEVLQGNSHAKTQRREENKHGGNPGQLLYPCLFAPWRLCMRFLSDPVAGFSALGAMLSRPQIRTRKSPAERGPRKHATQKFLNLPRIVILTAPPASPASTRPPGGPDQCHPWLPRMR